MSQCKTLRAMAVGQVRLGAPVTHPHLDACPECAHFVQTQRELHAALTSLSQEAVPAVKLESKLLAEFDAPRQTPASRARWWMPAAALAVALAVASVVIHRPAAVSAEQPFIEIPYIAPLAPYERTTVVRMDVSGAALIAAGFDLRSPDTGAAFAADVLLGQDGRAHAIRLVKNSNPNSYRRVTQ